MTAATMKIERSGPAIQAALARFDPDEVVAFETELSQAITGASATLDPAAAQAALGRWWGIAALRANPLSESEQAQLARAREGDFSGLPTRDEHGEWSLPTPFKAGHALTAKPAMGVNSPELRPRMITTQAR